MHIKIYLIIINVLIWIEEAGSFYFKTKFVFINILNK